MKAAAVLCVLVAALGAEAAVVGGAGEGRSFVGFLSGEAQAAYRAAVAPASGRIIGGYEAIVGEVPYQGAIMMTVPGIDGTGLCGGSVISATSVVTAAHCLYDGVNHASTVQVALGAHRINEYEDHSHRANTDSWVLHPDYNPWSTFSDIAVVKLPTAVVFTPYIQPVALSTEDQSQDSLIGDVAYVSGWGRTSNGDTNASQFLRRLTVTIISNYACAATLPTPVTEENICASGIQGGAVCNGDSGGPLVVYRDARPLLIGLTSFRDLSSCQSTLPSLFTGIAGFVSWLETNK